MVRYSGALILAVVAFALLAGCESTAISGQQSQWATSLGGELIDQRQSRATALCAELTHDAVHTPVRVHVLNNPELAAYSWSSGDIYVSSGLMDALPDDQLRACMAHEMGHLLNDRHCDAVAALEGGRHAGGAGEDEEKAADATGARLLTLQGYHPLALADALQTLHDSAACGCPREALEERIATLRASYSR